MHFWISCSNCKLPFQDICVNFWNSQEWGEVMAQITNSRVQNTWQGTLRPKTPVVWGIRMPRVPSSLPIQNYWVLEFKVSGSTDMKRPWRATAIQDFQSWNWGPAVRWAAGARPLQHSSPGGSSHSSGWARWQSLSFRQRVAPRRPDTCTVQVLLYPYSLKFICV